MNSESVFRMLFWVLLAGLFIVRVYFNFQARKAGQELMPDNNAIEREGRFLFAVRFASFFLMAAILVIYAVDPAWLTKLSIPIPAWLRWTGFFIGLFSLAFLVWTQATLGKNFSPQLRLQKEHHLVTTGPYARIRHPLYTALSGVGIAFALITASWLFVLLAVLIIFGLIARVPREEQMMLTEFGDDYRNYMLRTGRFFPK
jgi:protein-S-isoprenylcysteine O-methyltransferase Ste14